MRNDPNRVPIAPTLGVACVGRPTFVVEYAEQIAARAVAELQATGLPVVGDATLLMDAAAGRAAGEHLAASQPDALVIVCATFSDASMAVELAAQVAGPVVLWAVREPGPVGDRLWLNSLCGANIASHALRRAGRHVTYLYGDPGEAGLLAPLLAVARAAAVRRRLRASRVALVGGAPVGFYGAQFDELALARTVGTTVVPFDLATIFAAAAVAPEAAVEAAVASTAARSPSLETIAPPERRRFGQAYVALRDALRTAGAEAIAVRCWPEFPTEFGLMPCATLGRLADDGFVHACEADLHGAVTGLILQWLSGQAPLEADVVAQDDAANDLTLWHCGNAPACLARDGEEPTLTTHCNRKIGVAGNFALRPGPATIARLSYGADGYRLFFLDGAITDDPVNRFQGNTAHFRPAVASRRALDTIFASGLEHHVVFVAGHHAASLAALADLLGIPPITIPASSPATA